jgi:hypothetical protein
MRFAFADAISIHSEVSLHRSAFLYVFLLCRLDGGEELPFGAPHGTPRKPSDSFHAKAHGAHTVTITAAQTVLFIVPSVPTENHPASSPTPGRMDSRQTAAAWLRLRTLAAPAGDQLDVPGNVPATAPTQTSSTLLQPTAKEKPLGKSSTYRGVLDGR